MNNLILPFVSFIITLIITPIIGKYNKNRGMIGVDLHKIEKYEVPEAGGISPYTWNFARSNIILPFDL